MSPQVVPAEGSPWSRRLRLAGQAVVIASVEGLAGASVWLTLLLYSRFYVDAAYSRLLPWLACYQLISVVAPFGSSNALGKLLQGSDRGFATRVYEFLPKYTLLNLPWTVPLAFGLTWASTRATFAEACWLEASIAVGTGTVAAIQRSQQQVSVLIGQTRRYSVERSSYGAVALAGGLAGAWIGLGSIAAFFGGQALALGVVSGIRRTYPRPPQERREVAGLYREIFRASWVFGAWSIFGWFSGLGMTIVLSRLTTPIVLAVYGQVLAALSLLQLGLGAGTTAIQSSLLSRGVAWHRPLDRRLNRVYDAVMIAGAVCAAGLILAGAETWWPFRALRLEWPSYAWVYLFSAAGALTLYQRVMLRHQYDRAVDLSWIKLAIGEALGVGAFGVVLLRAPSLPLAASAAMVWARTITLYMTHEPLDAGAQVRKVQTVALGLMLSGSVWAIAHWWHGGG